MMRQLIFECTINICDIKDEIKFYKDCVEGETRFIFELSKFLKGSGDISIKVPQINIAATFEECVEQVNSYKAYFKGKEIEDVKPNPNYYIS